MRALLGLAVLVILLAAFATACSGGDDSELSAIGTNGPIEPNEIARVTAQAPIGSVCTLTVGEIKRTDVNDPERTQGPKSPERNREIRWTFGVPREAIPQFVTLVVNCNKENRDISTETTIEIVERTRPYRTETPVTTGSPTATATP
jgi:hypothetical protein